MYLSVKLFSLYHNVKINADRTSENNTKKQMFAILKQIL